MSMIVVFCACDSEGKREFTDTEIDDLKNADIGLLRALSEKAIEISGLGDDSGND